ncbi:MAG: DNA mismatch repair endonuclease MutL [Dehalococcoidia bacterium]|nr:DNA mismatch repair endonuclease MutL [Dehalococcoidia bacterium]
MTTAEEARPVRAIRILPPEVAARIAAGEVVERPVSVVRELLDNAIDAGASRITLEIADGGVSLIRVIDDGRGIRPEDIELAFERHATSKIAALVDLERVHTLGFRGEALPSIAAAADVEVLTRAAGEPVAVFVALAAGRVVRRMSRPSPVGTSMTIRDLFGRVPARRKFLGTAVSESRAVVVLATHYALAYPGVAFQVVSNGRRVLTTSGDGDIRHAFAAVYSAETAAAMLDVDYREDAIAVSGLAGPSSVHRGNRSAISVFVNGRWVQSRPLAFAVVDAYQSQLPIGRFPVAAVHIALPDDEVDVNVHPAKAEVRFRDERAVGRAVRHAIQSALEESRPVAWGPPAATSPARVLAHAGQSPAPLGLRGPQPVQASLELTRRTLEGAGTAPPADHTQRGLLPLLRVVGQMGATYVVAEGPDGMYLIDQHAAHERVVYDRLVAKSGGGESGATQPLLEPVLLDLEAPLIAVLDEHRDLLHRLGLETEAFGERSVLIRAVPAGLGAVDLSVEVTRLLEKLQSETRVPDAFGRAAATVACHSSVRAGIALAMDEMRRLVEDLERTTAPRTCPHGRPTLIHMGTEAIERQFGRR